MAEEKADGEVISDSFWASCCIERSVPIEKNFLQVESIRQSLVSLAKEDLQKVCPEIDQVILVVTDWHLLGE